jgi:hypothetical protein
MLTQHSPRPPFSHVVMIGLCAALLALTLAACGSDADSDQADGDGAGMTSMAAAPGASLPPVGGFYDGQRITFVHPEASDPEVAKVLTDMMGSPVLVVPELADAPRSALADIYAFENGVRGDGPFGFQPDVFDSAPGDDDYSPLRAVHLVNWSGDATPRVLRSAEDVAAAERAGELTVERTDVVVNMPFVEWPSGSR